MGVVEGMWPAAGLRSPECTALVWIFKELLPLPAHAGLGVFEDDALLQELVADAVGEGKVAGLLGGGALGQAGFDFGIGKLARFEGGGEHVEDGIEAGEEFERGMGVFGEELLE